MRNYTVTLAGREIPLGITWGASQELAEKVADPLVIMQEAQTRAIAAQAGLRGPKGEFQWTGKAVADVIFIGNKHSQSDEKLTADEVREIVLDNGLSLSCDRAIEYISNMMNPESDAILAELRAKQGGKSSGE